MSFKCKDMVKCGTCPINRMQASLADLLHGEPHPFKSEGGRLDLKGLRTAIMEQLELSGISDLSKQVVVVPMDLVSEIGAISVEVQASTILEDLERDKVITFEINGLDATALGNTCEDFQTQVRIDRSPYANGRWVGGVTPES